MDVEVGGAVEGCGGCCCSCISLRLMQSSSGELEHCSDLCNCCGSAFNEHDVAWKRSVR